MRRLIGGNRQSETKSKTIEFKFLYRSSYVWPRRFDSGTYITVQHTGNYSLCNRKTWIARLTFKTRMYLDSPWPPKSNKFERIPGCALDISVGIVKSSSELLTIPLSVLDFPSAHPLALVQLIVRNNLFVAPKLLHCPKMLLFEIRGESPFADNQLGFLLRITCPENLDLFGHSFFAES